MNAFTWMVVVATLATVISFASGITAMARNGAVNSQRSEDWMIWRVVFQAAAFAVILSAPLAR